MKREKSLIVENNVYSAKLPTQQKLAWVHMYMYVYTLPGPGLRWKFG